MSAPALRVPRTTPGSGISWFQLIGTDNGGGWTSNTVNAAYYNGKTYFSFLTTNGDMRVASFDHTTRAVVISPAIVSGLAIDYHNMPSVLVRSSDHKIVIAGVAHDTTNMWVATSTNAEDVSAWGAATNIGSTLAGTAYTYANLFQLSGESGKIYLFFRDIPSGTTQNLCYSTSTDGGTSWTAKTVIYGITNKESYWAIQSDSTSRIDFAVSDGTAVDGDAASVYHFYYSGGNWLKSDGTNAGTLPLGTANITKLYDGATNGATRVPNAVIGGPNPYVVFSAYNAAGAGSNENYWYAHYTGGAWSVHKIDDSGAVPENPGIFEGDLALDNTDPTKVFLSKKVSGRWQMHLYETTDGGSTWTPTQLTFGGGDGGDIHPISPRNAVSTLRCLWLSGSYGPAGVPFSFEDRGYPKSIPAP